MNLTRLNPEQMAPGLHSCLVQLALNTCIDLRAFEAWAAHNKYALIWGFGLEQLPAIYFRGWEMEQFANREQVGV